MAKRLLTSAVGIILLFSVILAPIEVLYTAVLIVTVGAICELNKTVTSNLVLKVVGVISSATVFLSAISGYAIEGVVFISVVYILLSVILFGKEKVQNIYLLGFSTVIFSLFFSTLVMLRKDYSVYELLLLFVFAWLTDSGAYFAGRFFGKHKLAPTLSPKKTVEGAVGGVVMCVVASIIYMLILKYCFAYTLFDSFGYLKMISVSIVASIISQIGDLSFSAIKRDYNKKDYGNILPGHGGILDRFDSVILVSPFVFFLLNILK